MGEGKETKEDKVSTVHSGKIAIPVDLKIRYV